MDRRRPEEVEADPLAADHMDKIGEDSPEVLFEDTTSDRSWHLFDRDYLSGGDRCQGQSRGRCKRGEFMQSVCLCAKYRDGDHSP